MAGMVAKGGSRSLVRLPSARSAYRTRRTLMAKLLVHLASGPHDQTRAALAFLVARTGVAAGHEVSMFLAGDAVSLLRRSVMDAATGIGTGSIREHYEALADAGARIYASGMSSKARGIDADSTAVGPIEFAPPDRLVELIFEADRVVTY
jgi:predicted peroxiredoxin